MQEGQYRWEKVESDIWTPKPGDRLTGYYLGREELNIDNRKANLYKVQTEKPSQKIIKLWGSKILDEKLLDFKGGELIRITFVEKKHRGSKATNIYEVERAL